MGLCVGGMGMMGGEVGGGFVSQKWYVKTRRMLWDKTSVNALG